MEYVLFIYLTNCQLFSQIQNIYKKAETSLAWILGKLQKRGIYCINSWKFCPGPRICSTKQDKFLIWSPIPFFPIQKTLDQNTRITASRAAYPPSRVGFNCHYQIMTYMMNVLDNKKKMIVTRPHAWLPLPEVLRKILFARMCARISWPFRLYF